MQVVPTYTPSEHRPQIWLLVGWKTYHIKYLSGWSHLSPFSFRQALLTSCQPPFLPLLKVSMNHWPASHNITVPPFHLSARFSSSSFHFLRRNTAFLNSWPLVSFPRRYFSHAGKSVLQKIVLVPPYCDCLGIRAYTSIAVGTKTCKGSAQCRATLPNWSNIESKLASTAEIPSCLSKDENSHTSLVPKKSTNKLDLSGPNPLLRALVSYSIHRSTWSLKSGDVVLNTILSTTAPTNPWDGLIGAKESHETWRLWQTFEAQVDGITVCMFSRRCSSPAEGIALDSSPKMTIRRGSRPIAGMTC